MKSRALMMLGRAGEAYALVDGLERWADTRPGVAMVVAEYAALRDKPQVVARNIVVAAKSHLTAGRVRGLFPYMAVHGQWQAIAACDNPDIPYVEFEPTLLAIRANLEVKNPARAAEIMRRAMRNRPNDPRFLSSLFALAAVDPGGEWEEAFAESFGQNVRMLTPDQLASYMEYALRLGRPDTAWLAWLALRDRDPRDPDLYLALARFGRIWLSFRRHRLGLGAERGDVMVDLTPFYRLVKDMRPFRALWSRVPAVEELTGPGRDQVRRKYLEKCFAEVRRREEQGEDLSVRMETAYVNALALAGRYDDAHARLVRMEDKYPKRLQEFLLMQAAFYQRQRHWQDLYETVTRLRFIEDYRPRAGANLMLVNAMMNLNLGMCAM